MINIGAENYENQLKYGAEVFEELKNLQRTGYIFEGYHHEIKVICCSDWKAGACLEGKHCEVLQTEMKTKIACIALRKSAVTNLFISGLNSATSKFFCRYCFCTKDDISQLIG